MDQYWIKNYVKEYFELNKCEIIEEDAGQIEVKLSTNVDKDLTNRPYYWTFIERTGTKPDTISLNLIFDPEKTETEKKGELIHPGSERLKQIFNSTKKRGRVVRLYQQPFNRNKRIKYNNTKTNQLNLWLGVNYKVEFKCDRKKDKIISLGINLNNGQMKNDFYKFLKTIVLEPTIPANVSLCSPFITLREAALQLEEWILLEISKENFDWANESHKTLEEELSQIEGYYSEEDQNTDEKDQRIEEVERQYSPKIQVSPINYGLFYLDPTSILISNILN